MLDINLNGALLCILSVLPVMRRQKAGRIVNISAVGAFLGSVCAHPAYGVSKAGLIAMTKSSVRPNSFVKFAHFVIPITESDRFYVNFILY